jgi:hypothetical protein
MITAGRTAARVIGAETIAVHAARRMTPKSPAALRAAEPRNGHSETPLAAGPCTGDLAPLFSAPVTTPTDSPAR